ncbi:MAG TPA: hypothetical protein VHV28_17975 [Solirubrobacteraceae bacterium]|jgi:hypothetical protein|nr:hypothetical protein [Solirubrobacteraceae bacterium]
MTPSPSLPSRSARRPAFALLAAVTVAVIAAGCGGNSPSSASVSGAAANGKGGPGEAAYQFSACMRNHGVNNFPDPKVKVSATGSSVAIGINPSISGQPAFKSAQKACQHILGKPDSGPESDPAQQRARLQAALAFAHCLRTHGFPAFPDPDSHGDLSPQTIAQAGISFHNPALLSAGENCASVTHGVLTRAQVAQAIQHANASGTQSASGG